MVEPHLFSSVEAKLELARLADEQKAREDADKSNTVGTNGFLSAGFKIVVHLLTEAFRFISTKQGATLVVAIIFGFAAVSVEVSRKRSLGTQDKKSRGKRVPRNRNS